MTGPGLWAAVLVMAVWAAVLPAKSSANEDVYDALPPDTRLLQFGLGDLTGDSRQELAVLYTTAEETRLTLFRGESGRWTKWIDDSGVILGMERAAPRSMELADTNSDGVSEILLYYLTEGNTAMTARVLAVTDTPPSQPGVNVILEDSTSPPGYPLLGTEEQSPSVTFMRMATGDRNGYRRVYCWKGDAFEKCKEVEWEKP